MALAARLSGLWHEPPSASARCVAGCWAGRLSKLYSAALDVTAKASVARGINCILACEGRLDVVINNAGYSLAGAVEDTTLEEAQAQLGTNFFGVLRVCRTVLLVMREQGRGYVINMSSLAGLKRLSATPSKKRVTVSASPWAFQD